MGLKGGITFSNNYCTTSRKLSCKPVRAIKMAKKQLQITQFVAHTTNNMTSEAAESVFALHFRHQKMQKSDIKTYQAVRSPLKKKAETKDRLFKNLLSVNSPCTPEFLNVSQKRKEAATCVP